MHAADPPPPFRPGRPTLCPSMAPANPQLAHDLTRRALREHEADPEPAAGLRFPGARRLRDQNPAADRELPAGPGVPGRDPASARELPGPDKTAAGPSAGP